MSSLSLVVLILYSLLSSSSSSFTELKKNRHRYRLWDGSRGWFLSLFSYIISCLMMHAMLSCDHQNWNGHYRPYFSFDYHCYFSISFFVVQNLKYQRNFFLLFVTITQRMTTCSCYCSAHRESIIYHLHWRYKQSCNIIIMAVFRPHATGGNTSSTTVPLWIAWWLSVKDVFFLAFIGNNQHQFPVLQSN